MIFFLKNLLYFVIIIVNIIFNLFDKSGERRTREERAKGSTASTSTIHFFCDVKIYEKRTFNTKKKLISRRIKEPVDDVYVSILFIWLHNTRLTAHFFHNFINMSLVSNSRRRRRSHSSRQQRGFIGAIWSIKDDFNRFSHPYTHYSCLRCVPSPKSYDNIPIRLTMKTFNDCQDFFFFNFSTLTIR